MNALSMPIIPSDTYTPLELACEAVVAIKNALRFANPRKRELLYQRLRVKLQYIDADLAASLRAKGQKSKKIRGFLVTTGVSEARICACHGAFMSDCDTIGPVEVIAHPGEPWVSVKALSEDK